ncbi:MAG: hypothetical protein ACR2H5_15710 [Ktedonobacteraceae bacterium]
MYISIEQLGISLRKLDPINPFFGVSFLAFKESGLRIGDPQPVNIAEEETSILEAYYNPLPASDYYYMPLRKTGPKKKEMGIQKKVSVKYSSENSNHYFCWSFYTLKK